VKGAKGSRITSKVKTVRFKKTLEPMNPRIPASFEKQEGL
jgi:hypothetical protein